MITSANTIRRVLKAGGHVQMSPAGGSDRLVQPGGNYHKSPTILHAAFREILPELERTDDRKVACFATWGLK